MGLKEIFQITRGTRVVLTITATVAAAAILFAFFYYRSINRAEDPRIKPARQYLTDYDRAIEIRDYQQALACLDSAMNIFSQQPEYRSSFETGIIYNNKCTVFLLNAIYGSNADSSLRETLLNMAGNYCDTAIAVYRKWIDEWGGLSEARISEKAGKYMRADDQAFEGLRFGLLFKRRVRNLVEAQVETPRRLSVSLTNRATIYRHLLQPDSSLKYLNEALVLWKDNRIAKSNLNVLMGGEPVKPSVIETLFPPDRKKN